MKKTAEEILTEMRGMLMEALIEGLQPGEEIGALKRLIDSRKRQMQLTVSVAKERTELRQMLSNVDGTLVRQSARLDRINTALIDVTDESLAPEFVRRVEKILEDRDLE